MTGRAPTSISFFEYKWKVNANYFNYLKFFLHNNYFNVISISLIRR